MASTTVFDIHFLQEVVCHGLTTRDIRRCMLVCRSWRTNFAPFLWQTIIINRKFTFNKIKSAALRSRLIQNAIRVQSIDSTFADIWPFFQSIPINNLTVLRSPVVRRLNWNNATSNNYNRDIITLLNLNPNLHTLELGHFSNGPETLEDLLDAIQNHKSLLRIKIDHPKASLSSPLFGLVLLACLKLESIYINIRIHSTSGQLEPIRDTFLRLSRLVDKASPTTTLKELHLPGKIYRGDHYVLMGILALCPRLEQITLPRMSYFDATQALTSAMTNMPQLQHLNIRSANVPFVHLVEIFRACAGLKTIIAGHSPRSDHAEWTMTTELLHNHNTLEVLDLTGSGPTGVTGAMMHALLCACPNLLEFVAMGPVTMKHKHGCHGDPVLRVSDMEDTQNGSAWVCHGLRVLKLRFESGTRCESDEIVTSVKALEDRQETAPAQLRVVPRAMVDQLNRLTLLEDLRLGRVTPGIDQLGYQITALGRSLADTSLHRLNQGSQTLSQDSTITLSMTLEALSLLQHLKRLELRNLKGYLDKACLRNARKQWMDIEWIQYS